MFFHYCFFIFIISFYYYHFIISLSSALWSPSYHHIAQDQLSEGRPLVAITQKLSEIFHFQECVGIIPVIGLVLLWHCSSMYNIRYIHSCISSLYVICIFHYQISYCLYECMRWYLMSITTLQHAMQLLLFWLHYLLIVLNTSYVFSTYNLHSLTLYSDKMLL